MSRLARLDNWLSRPLLNRPANLWPDPPASFFSPLFNQLIAVADGISLFKVRYFLPMMSQLFDAVATDTVVYQPAMFIPPKIVSKDCPSIKRIYPFERHMKGKFTSPHTKEIVMEVIVADKYKEVFAEAEIEINAIVTITKIPSPINKDCARRQRCPADTAIRFRLTPENPRRTPV